jgi:predicted NAD/FAD-binding protein
LSAFGASFVRRFSPSATHGDQALRLLVNPTAEEARLGEFQYQANARPHGMLLMPRTPCPRGGTSLLLGANGHR